MPEKIHDDTFVINDVVLRIPPEEIHIQRRSMPHVIKALRSNSSIKTKSGHSAIDVNFTVPFIGPEEVNKKLRPLIAQFLLTPFCYIENKFLRDAILGGENDTQSMALALQAINIGTVPGEPHTIQVSFNFTWFNYLPYTPNFYFKDNPFDPSSGQKEPGTAFRLFYLSKLVDLGLVTLGNSDVTLETLEFCLAKETDEAIKTLKSVDESEVENFEGKLVQYLDVLEELKGATQSDEQLGDNTFLDGIITLKSQLDPSDPSMARASVNKIIESISEVTEKYENKKGTKADKLLRQLVSERDGLLETGSRVFNGEAWLEWPSTLQSEDRSEDSVRVFYRNRELQMGTNSLVVEGMTLSYQHLLVTIPLASHQYATCQYLGSSDVSVGMNIKCTNDAAFQEFNSFWNINQNNYLNANYVPDHFKHLKVTNELVQLMGAKDMMWVANDVHTIPGNPGIYQGNIEFIDAGTTALEQEKLVAIPRSHKAVRAAVWKAIFNHVSVETSANPGKLRITGHLQEAERQLIERVLSTNLWSNESWSIMEDIGAREHLTTAYRWMVRDIWLPSEIDVGHKSGIFSGKDGISHAFRNLLIVNSLTEQHVLGIDGVSRVLWGWNDNASGSLLHGGITDSDRATDIYKSGRSAAGDKVRATTESYLLGQEERAEKVRKAISAIKAWERAIDVGGNIKANGFIVEVEGQELDIREEMRSAGILLNLEKEVLAEIQKRTERNQLIMSSTRFTEGRTMQMTDSLAMSEIIKSRYLSPVKDEYSRLVDSDYVSDPREKVTKKLFQNWNEFATRTADVIINKYIDFPMFKEAQQLIERMNYKTDTDVYRDFPMEAIQDNVLQWVTEQEDILPPAGWRAEPDFYFVNETADSDISAIVPSEVIERVREDTRNFSNKVISENTTWYNEKYLLKTNPEFKQFLVNSQDSEITVFPDMAMQGYSGLSQVSTSFESAAQSSNNQSVVGGENIAAGMSPSLNQLGIIPQATRDLTQEDTAGAVLDGATSGMAYSPSEMGSYGVWVHPLPGSVITSYPGARKATFHGGTDFAYGGGDAATMNKPVLAAAAGIVKFIGQEEEGAGNYIKIRTPHPIYGELDHYYMHLNGFARGLKVGQSVSAGELIGLCGATGTNRSKTPGEKGAHLHFEIRRADNRNIVYYPFFVFNSKKVINRDPTGQGKRVILADLIPYGDRASPILPGQTGVNYGVSVLDKSIESFAKRWNQYGGYRMNRAYPGVYMSFIEEDAGEEIFRYDDFFSYTSIVDVQVSRSREVAADYAQVTLTNISGLLSNRKWWGTHLEDAVVTDGKSLRENPDDKLSVDTSEENPIDSFMLREGIKVELRLGYSNNALNLDPVLIGRIVGIQFSETDDIVVIEIQSLATELTQDIKGLDKAKVKDGVFTSDARTGPLLEEMIASPECVSFGLWKRREQTANTFKHILNDRWEWNPNPSADNIFAPNSAFLDPRTSFLTNNFYTQMLEVLTPAFLVTAGAGIAFHGVQKLLSMIGVKGAAPSSDNIGVYSALSYYIYQMTIWDVFKEMELRHPNYVAHPVPYYERGGGTARMTMFFGLPDQLYFAKDAEWSDDTLLDEIQERGEALSQRLLQLKETGALKEQIKDVLESIGASEEEIAKTLGRVKSSISNSVLDVDLNLSDRNAGLRKEVINKYKLSEEKKVALGTGAIQPFRSYHLLTSRHHIISNSIRARSTTTANAVTVQYAKDGDEDVKLEKQNGSNRPIISETAHLTMKLDPHIPEESTREAFHSFYNCQGEEMAKRYALSLLQKYAWQVYSGQLVILGDPSIKPYDICYIFDDYSDMYGPIQVRSVEHLFSHDTGFITVITPDMVATASAGAQLTQDHAMGLMAEAYLKRIFNVDVGLVQPGRTPVEGTKTTPFLHMIATTPFELANIFGFKRILFNTQFNWPVYIHPLLHHGEPIVAGFGPTKLLENEFTIDKTWRWVQKGVAGLVEKTSELGRSLRISPITTRGQYRRGRMFGGIRSTTYDGE